MREICRQDEMPDKSTVMRWLHAHEDFRDQYARAKEIGIEALAEDILDIADDASNDWMERHDSEGANTGWQFNGEAARRSQIRIDSRKWLLSKLAPKKYGDKLEVKQDTTVTHKTEFSDADLEAIAAGGSAGVAGKARGSQVTD